MPSADEADEFARRSPARTAVVLILCALGYALTLYIFYPGVMTIDARYIYGDMLKHFIGDWQSPVMGALWSVIDPIAPGPASMFLLVTAIYWVGIALIAATMARSTWWAVVLPLLAISPPAFVILGVVWRDVLFTVVWLLAAALVFASTGRNASLRRLAQVFALALVVFGVLLRPNAIPAAPLLVAYIFWPAIWRLKRVAYLYGPAFIVLTALVPAVYYGLFDAKRQHPLHGLFVFDLAGITYFTRENQFPVAWTPEQAALLLERCYPTDKWDTYWYLEPCKFVMGRLEGDQIFGTDAMTQAWRNAVVSHPFAYLEHRVTFMRTFLAGENLVMWTQDAVNRTNTDRTAYQALVSLHDALRPLWIFKPALWLLLCAGFYALAWRRRATPSGAFSLAVCGSGLVYVASYFAVGLASDYRYAYWTVLATLTGGAVLLPRPSIKSA
jgi:hypothetical protein